MDAAELRIALALDAAAWVLTLRANSGVFGEFESNPASLPFSADDLGLLERALDLNGDADLARAFSADEIARLKALELLRRPIDPPAQAVLSGRDIHREQLRTQARRWLAEMLLEPLSGRINEHFAALAAGCPGKRPILYLRLELRPDRDLPLLRLPWELLHQHRLNKGDIQIGRYLRYDAAPGLPPPAGRLRRLVAIKVLHGQHGDDRSRVERFYRGARKMAELAHQGIVRVLEPEQIDEGHHFFVMEYLPGGDLREAVLAGRVDSERALDLILAIGDVLTFAHERGIIHRDIKPANIVLGADGRPKLTDFDLVRAGDTKGGTRTGALGSLGYAAPEAMQRPQGADARADLYGLGMTAVFALHGADPSPVEVWGDPAGFVAALDAPDGVQTVLSRAIASNREERFETVGDFCEALTAARHSQAAAHSAEAPTDPGPPLPEVTVRGRSVDPRRRPWFPPLEDRMIWRSYPFALGRRVEHPREGCERDPAKDENTLMLLRVFTLEFDPVSQRFDDRPVRDFRADKEVISVTDHVFECNRSIPQPIRPLSLAPPFAHKSPSKRYERVG